MLSKSRHPVIACAIIFLLAGTGLRAASAQEAAGLVPLPPLTQAPPEAGARPTDVPASPPLTPAEQASVVILDWHTFLGTGLSGIDFSLKEFAAQLDAITAMGYRFVSLDDAMSGRIEGRANVVLTIDDGNHSIYQAYFDVMKPRGIVPTMFVYPAIILGHISYAITPERLAELAKDGCIIGAHGYHHIPLSDKSLKKDERDFMTEIKRPGPAIEKLLGAPPSYFAYPYGVYSTRAEEELKAAGYAWAFAADDKLRSVIPSDPALDRMAVPRTIVYRWNAKLVLKALKARLSD